MSNTVNATSCTNNTYSKLLSGGLASWSQSSTTSGRDVDLGSFSMDLQTIRQNIPKVANISKVTVSLYFRQSRGTTVLYHSKMKTTIYNSSTVKMNEKTSDDVGKGDTLLSYPLTNVTSEELYNNGITVHLKAYYRGTLGVTQYAKNLKAVIDWSAINTTAIKLNKSSTTLNVGATETLTYTTTPAAVSYPRSFVGK